MNRAEARDLATRALHAAMREDWPAVQEVFGEISTDGRAVTFALMAWCDWTLQAQAGMLGRPFPESGPLSELAVPAWIEAETGRLITDADEMPPSARWAGRLVAARAAMDHVQFEVLIRTMPGDGFKRGEYAVALLRGCAGIVNLTRRMGGAE